MSAAVQTPVEMLPDHNGRPVPWIAKWTGMNSTEPITVGVYQGGEVVATYETGDEIRDPNGVLWIREGITRRGEPEYAQVSAVRQRMAMRRRLCQVCGRKIESKVISWLIDPRQIVTKGDDTLTVSPPTCDECIPLTLELCPAMKKSHVIAKVLEYEEWGCWGAIVSYDRATGESKTVRQAWVNYSRTDYPFSFSAVVAKQRVVRWEKWKMETL